MDFDSYLQMISSLLSSSSDPRVSQNLRQSLTDVTEILNGSKSGDIVFYRLKDGEKPKLEFSERLKKSQASLIVVPSGVLEQSEIRAMSPSVVEAKNFHLALKKTLDFFYPIDFSRKKLVGVTGTNGKSTSVHWIARLASQFGLRGFSLGTLGVMDHEGNTHKLPSGLTTPGLSELWKSLHRFFHDHDLAAIEVSAHGLTYQRIFGLEFSAGGWTNFGQDHLDYYQDLETYFQAKLLFPKNYLNHLWVPSDCQKLRRSLEQRGVVVKSAPTLKERGLVQLPPWFIPQCNQNNLELALAILEEVSQNSFPHIDCTSLRPPAGRWECLPFGKMWVVIDSAHTPDALENLLMGVKKMFPKSPLWLVFGCGGNRDRSKRALMGQKASLFAERIFLTNDNPRFENPFQILQDIRQGVSKDIVVVEETSREKAITMAINSLPERGVCVVAGKGHEEYQEEKGLKRPFNDKVFVKNLLN